MEFPNTDLFWDVALAMLLVAVFIGIALDVYRTVLIRESMMASATAKPPLTQEIDKLMDLLDSLAIYPGPVQDFHIKEVYDDGQSPHPFRLQCDGKYFAGWADNIHSAEMKAHSYLRDLANRDGEDHVLHILEAVEGKPRAQVMTMNASWKVKPSRNKGGAQSYRALSISVGPNVVMAV
jgi:hypothetical protein